MFKNKRITNAKSHFKLEFDIKTDDENILAILEKIKKTINNEFDKNDLTADVMPTITKVDIDEFYEWRKVRRCKIK
jgi:divalent metal cation (Fe/Co/Zn/Cd) transporter